MDEFTEHDLREIERRRDEPPDELYDGYEPDDPKSPDYHERVADAADNARKREKGE